MEPSYVVDEKRRKREITIIVLKQILVKDLVRSLYTCRVLPRLYEGIVV